MVNASPYVIIVFTQWIYYYALLKFIMFTGGTVINAFIMNQNITARRLLEKILFINCQKDMLRQKCVSGFITSNISLLVTKHI